MPDADGRCTLTSDPIRDIEDPLVYGVRMSRATTCDILQAFRNECVQLGHHRALYPFEDRRVVDQAAKVAYMLDHLRDRFECR